MKCAGGLVVVVLVAALAGCGGGSKQTTTFHVYFLRNGKVQPVLRTESQTQTVAAAALKALGEGPTAAEVRDLGLSSAVHGTTDGVTISDGFARLPGSFSPPALAQLVYTLTQFPTVRAVAIGDVRYVRRNFEEQTPAILVESPLPFQTVNSPVRVTGTANTFEATFQYDLLDSGGKLLNTHFVTATSGSGTRGTFDFTVPFPAGHAGLGKLVVYELSAKDGSRIHVVATPVELTP